MKNKCLFVLLLALGCCHVQAQKSQKNPLPEALVQLNQKVDSELIPGIKRSPLIGISTDISPKRTAVNTAYVQSVILSGGIPYMIPVTDNVNPAKRKAMAVKNEKRFLKQKRNALKNPGYSRHPVKTQASFKRLLKAV